MRDPVAPKNKNSNPTTASNDSGHGRVNMEPSFKVSKFQGLKVFKEDQSEVNQGVNAEIATLKL